MSDLTPITRTENFLARIAGEDVKTIEPITRIEHFLQNIVDTNAGGGLSTDTKYALIACFEKVAWVDEHGQDYVDALRNALFVKNITSIEAVFTQGATIFYNVDTLDDLRTCLVVEAIYDDNTRGEVHGYALSGSLTVGESTITVSYMGETTSFDVTVSDFGTLPESVMISGYNSSNNNNTATPGPYSLYYNGVYTYDHTKYISAIKLKVQTSGQLSICIIPTSAIVNNQVTGSWESLIVKDTLLIDSTGEQTVSLNAPFKIPEDHVLVIGAGEDIDTVIWKYGSNGSQKGFGYLNGSSANSLGVDILVRG